MQLPDLQAFAESALVPAQLVLAMFGMGCVLRPGDFATVLQAPRALLLGLVLQLGFVPMLAWAFVSVLALTIEVVVRNVSIGLLLVSFFFPGRPAQGELLYVCLLYAGTSTMAVAPLIVLHRFGWSPVLGRRALPNATSAAPGAS